MRKFRKNNAAVSNILGYLFSLVISGMVMVSSILIINGVIDDKKTGVASEEAVDIANYVANELREAISMVKANPDSNYSKALDLPSKIAGKSYYIELTDSDVYIKSNDNKVIESCSIYASEGSDSGVIASKTYTSSDKILISYNKDYFSYKYDFGPGTTTSYSPVASGYLRYFDKTSGIGENWKYTAKPFRIPIQVYNPLNEMVYDVPVKIVLNQTNFNYDLANVKGYDDDTRATYWSSDLLFYDPNPPTIEVVGGGGGGDISVVVNATFGNNKWYRHWQYLPDRDKSGNPINTFDIIITFKNYPDVQEPKSDYVLFDNDNPRDYPITFSGSLGTAYCIEYSPYYGGNPYKGLAKFHYSDALSALNLEGNGNGSLETGYILGKLKDNSDFGCETENITIVLGDIYVGDYGDDDDEGTYLWPYRTIQHAISVANAGDTIYVFDGTYNYESSSSAPELQPIIIDKNINLVGETRDDTIIHSNYVHPHYSVEVTSNTGCFVSSLTIKDTNSKEDGLNKLGEGLKLNGCSDAIISNCVLSGNSRGILILNGADDNVIIDCEIKNNYGDYIAGRFENGDGLKITQSDNNFIYNCELTNEDIWSSYDIFDSDGIVIRHSSDSNVVENCDVHHFGTGKQLCGVEGAGWPDGIEIVDYVGTGPRYNKIINCNIDYINGPHADFIAIFDDDITYDINNNPRFNEIIGCTLGSSGQRNSAGIAQWWAHDTLIKDCKITGLTKGIWVMISDDNDIINCTIEDCFNPVSCNPGNPQGNDLLTNPNGDGIHIDYASKGNTISYCEISGCEGNAIHISDNILQGTSYDNTIEYCDIHDNDGGIVHSMIYLQENKNTEVKNCKIYNNHGHGIEIASGEVNKPENLNEGQKISYCDIYNNDNNGIVLYGQAHYNTITYNNIFCNHHYGIKIWEELSLSRYNEIHYNNFYDNDGPGDNPDAFDGTSGDDDWDHNFWYMQGDTPPIFISDGNGCPLGCDADNSPEAEPSLVKTIRVKPDSSCSYFPDTIQEGIDRVASDGTVIVESGTYSISDEILIDKPITLQGEGKPTIEYSGDGSAIEITKNDVYIDNFEIIGGTDSGNGTLVHNPDNLAITIKPHIKISNCSISNFINGTKLKSFATSIMDCEIFENDVGVLLDRVSNCVISNNDIYDNQNGTKIQNNSDANIIKNCDIYDNENGVYINGTKAQNNIIFRNTFSNIDTDCVNARDFTPPGNNNEWDNGSPPTYNDWFDYGGNFWADYTGYDQNYNGFGDTPYDIENTSNVDNLPLTTATTPESEETISYIQGEKNRPYSIEYWNPSGESVILVNLSIEANQNKLIYLYFGSGAGDVNIDEITKQETPGGGGKKLGVTSLSSVAWEDRKNIGWRKYDGIKSVFEKGEIDTIFNINVPQSLDPHWGYSINQTIYVVEAKVKYDPQLFNQGQANLILLSDNYLSSTDAYLVTAHYSSNDTNNSFYLHRRENILINKTNMSKSFNDWLLFKSYLFIAKNVYNNYQYILDISNFIYDYKTYYQISNNSIYQSAESGLPFSPIDPIDGWVGIGCGLLNDPYPTIPDGSRILVDWIRVRKAPLQEPAITLGPIQHSSCKWEKNGAIHLPEFNRVEIISNDPFNPGPLLYDYCLIETKDDSNPSFSLGEYLAKGKYTITVIASNYDRTVGGFYANIIDSNENVLGKLTFSGDIETDTKSTVINWPGGNGLKIKFLPSKKEAFIAINAIKITKGCNGISIVNG